MKYQNIGETCRCTYLFNVDVLGLCKWLSEPLVSTSSGRSNFTVQLDGYKPPKSLHLYLLLKVGNQSCLLHMFNHRSTVYRFLSLIYISSLVNLHPDSGLISS